MATKIVGPLAISLGLSEIAIKCGQAQKAIDRAYQDSKFVLEKGLQNQVYEQCGLEGLVRYAFKIGDQQIDPEFLTSDANLVQWTLNPKLKLDMDTIEVQNLNLAVTCLELRPHVQLGLKLLNLITIDQQFELKFRICLQLINCNTIPPTKICCLSDQNLHWNNQVQLYNALIRQINNNQQSEKIHKDKIWHFYCLNINLPAFGEKLAKEILIVKQLTQSQVSQVTLKPAEIFEVIQTHGAVQECKDLMVSKLVVVNQDECCYFDEAYENGISLQICTQLIRNELDLRNILKTYPDILTKEFVLGLKKCLIPTLKCLIQVSDKLDYGKEEFKIFELLDSTEWLRIQIMVNLDLEFQEGVKILLRKFEFKPLSQPIDNTDQSDSSQDLQPFEHEILKEFIEKGGQLPQPVIFKKFQRMLAVKSKTIDQFNSYALITQNFELFVATCFDIYKSLKSLPANSSSRIPSSSTQKPSKTLEEISANKKVLCIDEQIQRLQHFLQNSQKVNNDQENNNNSQFEWCLALFEIDRAYLLLMSIMNHFKADNNGDAKTTIKEVCKTRLFDFSKMDKFLETPKQSEFIDMGMQILVRYLQLTYCWQTRIYLIQVCESLAQMAIFQGDSLNLGLAIEYMTKLAGQPFQENGQNKGIWNFQNYQINDTDNLMVISEQVEKSEIQMESVDRFTSQVWPQYDILNTIQAIQATQCHRQNIPFQLANPKYQKQNQRKSVRQSFQPDSANKTRQLSTFDIIIPSNMSLPKSVKNDHICVIQFVKDNLCINSIPQPVKLVQNLLDYSILTQRLNLSFNYQKLTKQKLEPQPVNKVPQTFYKQIMDLHQKIISELPQIVNEAIYLEIDPQLSNFPFEYPANMVKGRIFSTSFKAMPDDLLQRAGQENNQTKLCIVGPDENLQETFDNLMKYQSESLEVLKADKCDPGAITQTLLHEQQFMWSGHGSGLEFYKHCFDQSTNNLPPQSYSTDKNTKNYFLVEGTLGAEVYLFGCQSVAFNRDECVDKGSCFQLLKLLLSGVPKVLGFTHNSLSDVLDPIQIAIITNKKPDLFYESNLQGFQDYVRNKQSIAVKLRDRYFSVGLVNYIQ